ncbi:hypothetical protein FRUB_02860 [Fimbriiglobus ruber]|uniref:Uncharacterized protein n=1 Tax=Fimbriiglobus ruber TaxID=1908690 RepID=A0A225DPN0_9BACT|nr:hypothetical protein FRUB_02860 [Fimbriiglobus ruber]
MRPVVWEDGGVIPPPTRLVQANRRTTGLGAGFLFLGAYLLKHIQ